MKSKSWLLSSGIPSVVSYANLNYKDLPIKFRIIPYHTFSGTQNMRLDNMFVNISNENSDPVLRFYGWEPFCVSLGFHQSRDVLDIMKLKRDGCDVVRRPTGGRAIFHAQELTYSIVMPISKMNHRELYAFSHQIIASALKSMGYAVELTSGLKKMPRISQMPEDFPCFTRSAETEVQFNEKKVVGSAQKILKTAILQHGSILIGPQHKQLSRYLNTNEKQLQLIDADIKKKTVCLSEIKKNGLTPEKIMTNVVKQLESADSISVYFQDLSKTEIENSDRYEIFL